MVLIILIPYSTASYLEQATPVPNFSLVQWTKRVKLAKWRNRIHDLDHKNLNEP